MSRNRTTSLPGALPSAPKEPKDVKFLRLARRRVAIALKRIEQVGALANRRAYQYTPEQAERIMHAMTAATAAACTKFTEVDQNGQLFDL